MRDLSTVGRIVMLLAGGLIGSFPGLTIADEQEKLADVADVPAQDLMVGDNRQMRYFLVGAAADAPAPAEPRGLLVVLPGGDGSAEFHPFMRRIYKNVLGQRWLLAQAVAPQWDKKQASSIVWPTAALAYPGVQFTTEEFIEAIIADVRAKAKIDAKRIFLLGWSSGGPPCYAAALRKETPVTGAFIAMSIFKPQQVSAIENARGRAFYLLQSKDDRVTPIRFAELAEETLGAAGASVRLERYDGGHGWRGNVWKMIGDGIQWLEKPVSASIKAADPALKDPAGTESPAGKPGANILLNPSFEAGDKSPADWESGAEIDGVEYVWDKNVGQKGKASLCLNKSAKRYFPIAQWSQIVKRETDRPLLQVSAQVKAERVTKATIDVIFLDENDEMISHEWAAYIGAKEAKDSPAQHDWKEYQGKVKIPAKTRKLQIGLQIYGPGKVWFDDLRAEYVK